MTESEVVAKVREFIVDNLLYMRPGFVLGDDDRLLEGRILDSMGVVEVLTFLTTEFGIRVPEADIRESNFGSLRAIARYAMESLTAAKGA